MQVILNKKVEKLGYRGDIVKVRSGYFRNFLLPNQLADVATPTRLKVAESRKNKMVMEKEQILSNAKDVLKKLKGLTVVVKAKLSGKGKLYASLHEADVVEALERDTKLKLEKSFVKMEAIKESGDHQVLIHLGPDLEEKITVQVVAQ